jgi:hypothetical protein
MAINRKEVLVSGKHGGEPCLAGLGVACLSISTSVSCYLSHPRLLDKDETLRMLFGYNLVFPKILEKTSSSQRL